MKRTHRILANATAVLALAAITSVSAAPQGAAGGCDGSGPGSGRMGMGMGQGHGMSGMHYGGFGGNATAGLAALKTKLAISPEQEAAWQAFATQATEQSSQMQAMRAQYQATASAETTAPTMMSLRIGAMTQRLEGMQAMNKSFTELYAVLTPQQRTTADQHFAQRGAGSHRHGKRG